LHKRGYELVSPAFLLDEVTGKLEKLASKAGISNEEISMALNLLLSWIRIIPNTEYLHFIDEGKKISPDIKDAPYFALALKLKCPIWSREPRLKRQKTIVVLDNKDIETLLKAA